LLRLRAEMRLPGLAWLELGVGRAGKDGGKDGGREGGEGGEDGRKGTGKDGRRGGEQETVYLQRAIFHPHGLAGHLYWHALAPFHGLIFGRMPRNVAAAAERKVREGRKSPVGTGSGNVSSGHNPQDIVSS
ncbi:DUF2867 domain-containing protein, partial [Streptosporangium algeriense]